VERPTKFDMVVFTKYVLAAYVVRRLLPDTWPQLVSVKLPLSCLPVPS